MKLRTGETTTVFIKHEMYRTSRQRHRRFQRHARRGRCLFRQDRLLLLQRAEARAHEEAEWPVVFFLDPALEKDETMAAVEEITLSYTFFAPPKAADGVMAANGRQRAEV